MPKSAQALPVAELDGRSDDSHAVFLLLGHGAFVPCARAVTAIWSRRPVICHLARRLTRVR